MIVGSARSDLTGRNRDTYNLKVRAIWNDHHGGSSGNSSVVECDLAKVEVAGSNPVSRSKRLRASGKWVVESGEKRIKIILLACPLPLTACHYIFGARYPSGKGEVCKTFTRGFDSHPRLQIICFTPILLSTHMSRGQQAPGK